MPEHCTCKKSSGRKKCPGRKRWVRDRFNDYLICSHCGTNSGSFNPSGFNDAEKKKQQEVDCDKFVCADCGRL